MALLSFSDTLYRFRHNRRPSTKIRGTWAFQETINNRLIGEMIFTPSNLTLAEAKTALRRERSTGTFAVLP